jgi:hypothetical protein
LHGILSALTGNIDIPDGKVLVGFNPKYIFESELGNRDILSAEHKAKQLGADAQVRIRHIPAVHKKSRIKA